MATIWRWNIAQSAERKWWQRYLKNKNVNEYLSWKKKYWQDFLTQCQPYFNLLSADASILDAGCGPSGIFIQFPQHAVTAFDPLLDAYEKDLPHFKKDNYPNVSFITSSIEKFSANKKYDYIFCLNAINHVQDIQKGYDKLIEYLRPNGILIVSIDAHNYSFFKFLFKLLPGDILHPHQYNVTEYNQFITNRGLQILATKKLKHEFFFDYYVQIAQKKSNA
jgi:2-polyprenyl-6-hydroxyphenyl methylase/3-demethylubiquinone-9 3-methyltransferase